MAEIPQFGEILASLEYILRPSVYAVLLNPEGLIGVVESEGVFFLPGGGIESGEQPEEALLREILEETGYDSHLLWPLAEAHEYVQGERHGWLKHSQFYLAETDVLTDMPPEETLHWLTSQQATERLSFGSQRWIIEKFAPYLSA